MHVCFQGKFEPGHHPRKKSNNRSTFCSNPKSTPRELPKSMFKTLSMAVRGFTDTGGRPTCCAGDDCAFREDLAPPRLVVCPLCVTHRPMLPKIHLHQGCQPGGIKTLFACNTCRFAAAGGVNPAPNFDARTAVNSVITVR